MRTASYPIKLDFSSRAINEITTAREFAKESVGLEKYGSATYLPKTINNAPEKNQRLESREGSKKRPQKSPSRAQNIIDRIVR
jgi:hypothetical protein